MPLIKEGSATKIYKTNYQRCIKMVQNVKMKPFKKYVWTNFPISDLQHALTFCLPFFI